MIYLVDGEWMRLDLVPTAVRDLVVARGTPPDPNVNNGITGDARRSSKELGKRAFDNKVEHAVRQIKTLIPQ
jgi:creatinine amidohydrolase